MLLSFKKLCEVLITIQPLFANFGEISPTDGPQKSRIMIRKENSNYILFNFSCQGAFLLDRPIFYRLYFHNSKNTGQYRNTGIPVLVYWFSQEKHSPHLSSTLNVFLSKSLNLKGSLSTLDPRAIFLSAAF